MAILAQANSVHFRQERSQLQTTGLFFKMAFKTIAVLLALAAPASGIRGEGLHTRNHKREIPLENAAEIGIHDDF